MKLSKDLHVGIFWIDRRDSKGWHWHGRDFLAKIKAIWEDLFSIAPHPLLSKCPSFGRFFTSGGNTPTVGCSIRYGKECRAGLDVRRECERITKLDIKERKRIGL